MKKNVVVLLVFVLLLLFMSCQTTPEQSDSWKNNGVKATVVEAADPVRPATISWISLADCNIKEDVDVVVAGTLKNKREIEVKYTVEDSDYTDYITSFDFKIDDAVHPSSLGKKTIRIYTGINSRGYDMEIEKDAFEEGKKYLIALEKLADGDIVKKGDISDYVIITPIEFMIPLDSGEEEITKAFELFKSEKNTNDIVENYKDTPPKTIKDFKKFLKDYFSDN